MLQKRTLAVEMMELRRSLMVVRLAVGGIHDARVVNKIATNSPSNAVRISFLGAEDGNNAEICGFSS